MRKDIKIKKILVSSSFTQKAFVKIQWHLQGHQVEQVDSWTRDEQAQALIVRSKDLINDEFLKLFPQLKFVVSATSGFDHFSLKTVHSRPDLVFAYSPEANVQTAAELSLFHILSFYRKGPALFKDRPAERRLAHLGNELGSKTVSIIGLGRIGSRLTRFLKALGVEVFAHDPYLSKEEIEKRGATAVGFKEALKLGEVVSLHCPLTQKTRHMINETSLSEMTTESLLVNCARGPLVCTNALIKALEEKQIRGACLDVFESEPLSKNSPLWKFPQVSLSPHIGGYTEEAQIKSALEAAQQVKNWFDDSQAVLNLIPPKTEWVKDLEEA